jgi:pimeloyl-ACP methyl ester carboxylesterase
VRPLLQEAGHQVYTPSLTGQGERSHLAGPHVDLSTHVQDVTNALWYEDLSDVILVGHSYGGIVVTGVADKMSERIQHLVFMDAFQPADGQSLFDLTGGGARFTADDWRIAPMARTEDPNDPVARWAAERRGPQSRATFEQKVALSVPLEDRPFRLTYIVATERPDPGPYFDETAARLRQNPRWTVHEVSGGHNMQLTNPTGLAGVLLSLVPVPV